jgi:hypothetical protein
VLTRIRIKLRGVSVARCPSCGRRDARRLVFGFPMPELLEAARRGDVVLGGPGPMPGGPNRACRSCGTRFRSLV